MANLNIPNSHVDGTVADADDVNANNQAVEDYINDRNDGTEAWDNLKVKETGGNNTVTLAVGTHAADRTYTIIDAGAAADVVVTEAAQTINGAKTFTDPITQTDTTNQLVLGTTRTVTINAPTPASSSRVVTIPDLSGDYSVVGTSGTQTISGIKTFDGQLIGKGTATNDSAAAGNIGQYMETTITSPTNFPTSGNAGDAGTLSLTAGDWDVSCLIYATANGATVTRVYFGIGTVTGNSFTGLVSGVTASEAPNPGVSKAGAGAIPTLRVSLAGSATYYFKVYSEYSAATPQYVGRISARRVR